MTSEKHSHVLLYIAKKLTVHLLEQQFFPAEDYVQVFVLKYIATWLIRYLETDRKSVV